MSNDKKIEKHEPLADNNKFFRGRKKRGRFRIFPAVSLQEKINFARYLSVGIKSGLAIIESLRLIQEQTASKKLKKAIEEIIKDVNNGQSLAQSLEMFEYIFGGFFINMVKVGETSGNLSSSLLHLSLELKKQREVNHRVRAALMYPVVILVVTLGITFFLTFFIFPKILPIFSSLRVELPLTTQIMIQTLTFMTKYGFHVIGGLIFMAILLRLLLALPKPHYVFDRLMLSMPLISKIVKNLTLTNFARSLNVLLKSGMTLIDALTIAKGTFHNLVYRRHLDTLIDFIGRGEQMARYLSTKPKFFPPMFAGMIRVGEETGNLEENLIYLAEHYEGEVDDQVKNLTTVLEPILLVFMGLLVGFVAVSIITPIYKITQQVKVK
ncbi:type II secretion system F family protein [Candidatus Jorgensenbacteria bacterium]|nr:type II secretion system F family protein [Candidatus Jorgensenbacteria bacterium]